MDEYNFNGWKLSHHNWTKRKFDATSPEDLAEYEYFLVNRRWYDRCPFIIEWPFNNVIDMIHQRIVRTHIAHLISKQELCKTRRA